MRTRDATELVPAVSRALPSRVGLIGDVHAQQRATWAAYQRCVASGAGVVFQLGDFGFPRHGKGLDPDGQALFGRMTEASGSVPLLVVPGNHEQYDQIDALPAGDEGVHWWTSRVGFLPRGWRATSPAGRVVAAFGGANSIDRRLRQERALAWTSKEAITQADLDRLGTAHVDVLLGHDAPLGKRLMAQLEAVPSRMPPEDVEYARVGQRMFHRAVRQVRPSLVVSGHYHRYLDSIEQFEDLAGHAFSTRMVILQREHHFPNAALLHLDTLELALLGVTVDRMWLTYG